MSDFSEQNPLELINEMISVAKRSFVKMSYYFLLWGWLLFAAGLTEYLLRTQLGYAHIAWIGWPIVGVLGGILAAVRGNKESKSAGATTYMNRVFTYLWGGFVVTLVLYIVASVMHHTNPGPGIIILTGLPTFVSGGIMRFKPLLIGGCTFWVLGIAAHVLPAEWSSLLFCLALVLGYLVPGYLLQKAERDGRV